MTIYLRVYTREDEEGLSQVHWEVVGARDYFKGRKGREARQSYRGGLVVAFQDFYQHEEIEPLSAQMLETVIAAHLSGNFVGIYVDMR